MKKIMFVLLIVASILTLACAPGQYQVKESFPADEAWMTTVCYPSNRDCRSSWSAVEVPGTGKKMPPPGAWCKIIDESAVILDCGKKYLHIQLFVTPV